MIDPKADPGRHIAALLAGLERHIDGDFDTEEEQAEHAKKLADLCFKTLAELTIESAMRGDNPGGKQET